MVSLLALHTGAEPSIGDRHGHRVARSDLPHTAHQRVIRIANDRVPAGERRLRVEARQAVMQARHALAQ